MTADDKIRDDTNREAAKILALLSGKIDKCEYLKVVLHGTICIIDLYESYSVLKYLHTNLKR